MASDNTRLVLAAGVHSLIAGKLGGVAALVTRLRPSAPLIMGAQTTGTRAAAAAAAAVPENI